MGMILRIASSRIVGQGDIVGRSGYFSLNLSANSVMRGRLDARRTLKSLVADLRGIRNKGHVAKPTIEHKTEKRSIAENQSGYAPLSFIRNLRKVTFCQVPQFPVSPYLSVPPWLHFRTMQGGISSLLRSPHAKC